MGNSSSPSSCCVDEKSEFLEWLTDIRVRDPEAVYQILHHQNITNVKDLVYSFKDLEPILSSLDLYGDKSKIRRAVVEASVSQLSIPNESTKNNTSIATKNNVVNNLKENKNENRNGVLNNSPIMGDLMHKQSNDLDEEGELGDYIPNPTEFDDIIAPNQKIGNKNNNKNNRDRDNNINGVAKAATKYNDEKENMVDPFKVVTKALEARNDIESLNDDTFIFKNKMDNKISRMDLRRPMILALFERGRFDHSKVRLIYFSKIVKNNGQKNKNIKNLNGYNRHAHHGNGSSKQGRDKLLVRVFSIDLYIDEVSGKNILSIEGPLSDRVWYDDYKCVKYFTISNLCINDLVKISKNTMNNHGDYNVALNNCRDFSKKLLENTELMEAPKNNKNNKNKNKNHNTQMNFFNFNNNNRIEVIDDRQECWILQTYVNEYFDNNFSYSKSSLSHIDENDSSGSSNGHKNRKNKHIDYGNNREFVESETISFDLVKKTFSLHRKYNNNLIAKQGYLKKKSRHMNKWKKRYCVLTVNAMLFTFKDYKMMDEPTETIQIRASNVAINDNNNNNNNIFYVNNFTFEAESNELMRSWIKWIKHYGGRSSANNKTALATRT